MYSGHPMRIFTGEFYMLTLLQDCMSTFTSSLVPINNSVKFEDHIDELRALLKRTDNSADKLVLDKLQWDLEVNTQALIVSIGIFCHTTNNGVLTASRVSHTSMKYYLLNTISGLTYLYIRNGEG